MTKGDWITEEGDKQITELLNGKTVELFEGYNQWHHDYIAIRFTDNTELVIRYDFIYDWEIREYNADDH